MSNVNGPSLNHLDLTPESTPKTVHKPVYNANDIAFSFLQDLKNPAFKAFEDCQSMVDIVQFWAHKLPAKTAFTFEDPSHPKKTINYATLCIRAKAVAATLQTLNIRQKERVLLLIPQSLDFIDAFLGCLFASQIAVPAYPPKMNKSILRLNNIFEDCTPKVIISTRKIKDKIERLQDKFKLNFKGHWLCIDEVENLSHLDYKPMHPDPEDLAFLQYTSGSTGEPKGVMVSHDNIMANEKMIQVSFHHEFENLVSVGWLPFFHDMGLIGNILQPIYTGGHMILTNYVNVLQSPLYWLELISKYRASTSGGPNFIYDLCLEKVTAEDRQTLDLSCWKVAFNGAEPIRPESMKNFADIFSVCGFSYQNFFPCYGLAETTLMVSGVTYQAAPKAASFDADLLAHNQAKPSKKSASKKLIHSGFLIPEQEVLIVDPDSKTVLSQSQVGEIWVKGPQVTKGYWQKPEKTKTIFHAMTTDNRGPFLRTGDLGFFSEKEELYITGRLKNVMIINGKNIYPQDVEALVANAHDALRPHFSGSIAYESEGQKLCVVAEVSRQYLKKAEAYPNIVLQILDALSSHDIFPSDLILIKTNTLAKTSSGKIRHFQIKEDFLNKNLHTLFHWTPTQALKSTEKTASRPPKNDTERSIIKHLETHYNFENISIEDSLFSLGLNSIQISELTASLEEEYLVTITLDELMSVDTLALLSDLIEEKQLEMLQQSDIKQLESYITMLNPETESKVKKESVINTNI